jgi:hypothetical protein
LKYAPGNSSIADLLKSTSHRERSNDFYCSRIRTKGDAGTIKIAFLSVCYNWWLSFFPIGCQDIAGADFNTEVTPFADIRVKINMVIAHPFNLSFVILVLIKLLASI